MQLISSPISPFVRKIRTLVHEAGKTESVEEIVVATTALATDAQAKAANPLGKIPALIRNDGPTLYDSRVISRYLNDIWNLNLYPQSHLYETLTLEATADGIMESCVLCVYESRLRPEEMQFKPWTDAQLAKALNGLVAIESRWMSHLNGPLDMAQLAVCIAIDYLEFRIPDADWRSACPTLSAWHTAFKERPSLVATRPV